MHGLRGYGWLIILAAALAGCDKDFGDTSCVETADELTAALAEASDGDTVHVCDGRFEGSFDVPAGVSVDGAGIDATALVAPEGETALRLQPGVGQRSDVKDLSIEWSSKAGIVAIGEGAVDLSSVSLSTTGIGIGIGADGLAELTLADVRVTGPVGEMDADEYPYQASVADWIANTPAYGLVVVHVDALTVDTLDVHGFAAGGVQLVESSVTWTGGSVCGVFGTGVLIYGGDATIDETAVCDLWQEGRLIPTVGVFAAAGASLSTTGLTVTGLGSEGGHDAVGLVQDGANGTHDGLVVLGNESGGVRVQHSQGTAAAPSLSITNGDLSGNGKGGLIALESSGVVLTGVTIDETRIVPTIDRLGGTFDMGDAVQIVRCADADAACETELADISLTDVSMTDNGRIGILLSANNGSAAGVSVSNVTVSGQGTMLGAVSQLASDEPTGWASITREGATVDNDAGFAGTLETVGIIDPEVLPATELAADGLGAALGL